MRTNKDATKRKASALTGACALGGALAFFIYARGFPAETLPWVQCCARSVTTITNLIGPCDTPMYGTGIVGIRG